MSSFWCIIIDAPDASKYANICGLHGVYSSLESSQAIIDSLTKVLSCEHIASKTENQILTGPNMRKELLATYCDVDETDEVYVYHWKFTSDVTKEAEEEKGPDPRTPVNFRRINSSQFARKSTKKKKEGWSR